MAEDTPCGIICHECEEKCPDIILEDGITLCYDCYDQEPPSLIYYFGLVTGE